MARIICRLSDGRTVDLSNVPPDEAVARVRRALAGTTATVEATVHHVPLPPPGGYERQAGEPEGRCPYCSFQPTSRNDFCSAHRGRL